ncbi:MAG: DoxX family protein [Chitinophagales bacterium]
MNTAIWVIQGALALFFLMPAKMKLMSSPAQLEEKKMLEPGASATPVRIIGLLELLGSIGIIVPWLTGILPILTPLAAVGFCLVMVGAALVHAKKSEWKVMPLLAVVFILSALVAWYRF